MVKTILKIDGMACGMCESHVNDTIRKVCDVKKVSSSHKKGLTEILSEDTLDETVLKNAMENIGYRVLEVDTMPYVKKGLKM